jgi:hypothetical protein
MSCFLFFVCSLEESSAGWHGSMAMVALAGGPYLWFLCSPFLSPSDKYCVDERQMAAVPSSSVQAIGDEPQTHKGVGIVDTNQASHETTVTIAGLLHFVLKYEQFSVRGGATAGSSNTSISASLVLVLLPLSAPHRVRHHQLLCCYYRCH